MKDKIIEQSQKFWKALERADSRGMREVSDPACWFVHIGISCGLDEEMETFDKKLFQPTKIDIHGQEVREFLTQSTFRTDYFYMILTYGNRHGGAAELTQKLLEDLGIHPSYINVVLMVDNFLPGFDMNEQKALDKNVDGQIERIVRDIESGKEYISPVTDTDRAAHQEYLDRIAGIGEDALSKVYRITEECIGCGICTKVCPKKCLHMEGQKSVWEPEGCMMCIACIHTCPMMAIQMNMPEKNKEARYRNENISICEIVDANNQWGEETAE